MPELPSAWEELLGDPQWRIEWVNEKGRKGAINGGTKNGVEISLPQTLASAVLALPYWPQKGIGPGVFRPAGAIFPFDAAGKNLVISWQGGVDAILYREFASAAGGREGGSAAVRLPYNFNWPRFRQLFDDPAPNADVRRDPWLADWKSIAEKTIQSGFDRRRLTPEARSDMAIPVGPGPWIGTSPFAASLFFDGVPAFPVRAATDTWVSAEGILRCNNQAWSFVRY
jgi:hypothetical protein